MIIDTNISCLGKASYLKGRSVSAVGRYYRDKTRPEWRIGKEEAQELSTAGIKLFMVFEDYGHASLLVLSKEQGASDAKSALQQAESIGQPAGSAIYFALEGLPDGYKSADLPDIRGYFSGITEVLNGKYQAGVYGNGIVCETLLKEKICQYTWLAAASTSFENTCKFFGGMSPRWSLAQVPPLDLDWDGLSIDININNPRLNDGDFGEFVVNLPSV